MGVHTGIDLDEVAKLGRLVPETVAESVLFAINQPANSRITEIVVYPMTRKATQ